MAHSLSAKKRVRQNRKKRKLNRARKSQVKSRIKSFERAVESGDVNAANEEFRKTVIKLDKISSTSALHKRTVARKKSRLAKKLNMLQAGQSE